MRTHRFVTTSLLIILPACMAAGVKGQVVGSAAHRTPTSALVEAPTEWVAFSADFAGGLPGRESVMGRFFQASNGSTRLETGPIGDAARVVFIKNIAASAYYSRRVKSDGGVFWISGPMVLPSDGWKPMQMTEEPGRRVVLREKIEGFEVVQIGSGGSVSLFAPRLNFHPLVVRRITTGYGELYHNVRLGEPAAELFTPPPGEEIRRTETPGGIEVSPAHPGGN